MANNDGVGIDSEPNPNESGGNSEGGWFRNLGNQLEGWIMSIFPNNGASNSTNASGTNTGSSGGQTASEQGNVSGTIYEAFGRQFYDALVANGILGPDYDPKNGGEVQRQLANWEPGKLGLYMVWLNKYYPDIFQSGDVWNGAGPGGRAPWHASRWNDAYVAAVNSGLNPSTFFLDKNCNVVKLPGMEGSKDLSGSQYAAGISFQFVIAILVLGVLIHLAGKKG